MKQDSNTTFKPKTPAHLPSDKTCGVKTSYKPEHTKHSFLINTNKTCGVRWEGRRRRWEENISKYK
jgi:hypothetical protein